MDEGPRLHRGGTPGDIGGEPELPSANAEAARLLRDPAFIAKAAEHFNVGPLKDGEPRSALSNVLYRGLDGLAHAIEREARPELSFTYTEWASIGNTLSGIRWRKRTSAEGVASAIRRWAKEPGPIPGRWPLQVRLEFTTSDQRRGNTPGTAALSAEFKDARGTRVALSNRGEDANDLRLYLLSDDDVLVRQSSALVAYARKIRLTRVFSWPPSVKQPDYRVDVVPSKAIERSGRHQRQALGALAIIVAVPIFLGGWYARERESLKTLLAAAVPSLIRLEPKCLPDGKPALEVRVTPTLIAETYYLVRRDAAPSSPWVELRAFRHLRDYRINLQIHRRDPNMSLEFLQAFMFTDTTVDPGQAYVYKLGVKSSLGELFVDERDSYPVKAPICPR